MSQIPKEMTAGALATGSVGDSGAQGPEIRRNTGNSKKTERTSDVRVVGSQEHEGPSRKLYYVRSLGGLGVGTGNERSNLS